MRIPVNNKLLPGITVERIPHAYYEVGERARKQVFDVDGALIGAISYVGIRHDDGVHYGWRIAGSRHKPDTQIEAIKRLIRLHPHAKRGR